MGLSRLVSLSACSVAFAGVAAIENRAPFVAVTELYTDILGHDLATRPAASASNCTGLCIEAATDGCVAWTFKNGVCFLKSNATFVRADMTATSARLLDSTSPTYVRAATHSNRDYVGNDLGTAPAAQSTDCVDLCRKFPGCRVFAWNTFGGGTCYFKAYGDASTFVDKPGVWAGEAYPSGPFLQLNRARVRAAVPTDLNTTGGPNVLDNPERGDLNLNTTAFNQTTSATR